MRKHLTGFTLIELLIVMVIIAILTASSVAVYSSFARKSRRADAANALLTLSSSEEQYRSNNSTYGTLTQINGNATSAQGYYSISISGVTATGYTITATGTGTQANDTEGSTSCASLVLTASNGTLSQTPAVCWPS